MTMRAATVLCVLTLSTAASGRPKRAADVVPKWLHVGTVLVYGVDHNLRKYDFIVTVKKLAPEVVFDWVMTSMKNRQGTVVMEPQALASAKALHNMFFRGKDVLKDKTSVWVSRLFFEQYRKKVISQMLNTGSDEEAFMPDDKAPALYEVLAGGKRLSMPVLALRSISKDGHHLTLHDNLAAPIIVRMELGWKIWLKEIK